MVCKACQTFGIVPRKNPGLGQLPVATLPVPKQVDPRTVTLVLGASAVLLGLAVWFWYTRRGS